MSDEDKPPSPEELKAMMERAKKIADEKKAEQESKVKKLNVSDDVVELVEKQLEKSGNK